MNAIDCLTSRDGENYDEFITCVLTSLLAVRVKLLDIEDNMDMTRLGMLDEKDLARLQITTRAACACGPPEVPMLTILSTWSLSDESVWT